MTEQNKERAKVFIGWAGDRSKAVGTALHEWIPMVVQAAIPWMSKHDIQAGAKWYRELDKVLGECKFGIVCVTPENLSNVYIHFEAGAVAKAVDNAENARVIPYLLELENTQVTGPLSDFQMQKANREGTLNLMRSINKNVNPHPLDEGQLDGVFGALWPHLEKRISEARDLPGAVAVKRDTREMIAEILERIRSLERHVKRPFPSSRTRVVEQVRNDLAHRLGAPISRETYEVIQRAIEASKLGEVEPDEGKPPEHD